MKIVVVDYGMGNLQSIRGAVRHLGYDDIRVTNDYEEMQRADKLVLPGVGNYASAMRKINEIGMAMTLKELVLGQAKPILGICLGMQLMGYSSTEGGYNEGLGLINGKVSLFDCGDLKVPHVGYDQITPVANSRLFSGIREEPDFYFTHSYRMQSDEDIGQSNCVYGEEFVASFEENNIAGVQFHPEISQSNGLQVLKNFFELF